jgi:hypothetical protein
MQVDKLKSQLETQNSEKVNWETRVEKLEKKIHDLNSKLEDVSCYIWLDCSILFWNKSKFSLLWLVLILVYDICMYYVLFQKIILSVIVLFGVMELNLLLRKNTNA